MWGMRRQPVDSAEMIGAVMQLRSALILAGPAAAVGRDPDAGNAAREAMARLRSVTNSMPRLEGKLAENWSHAARMRYWHDREIFTTAEEHAFATIQKCREQRLTPDQAIAIEDELTLAVHRDMPDLSTSSRTRKSVRPTGGHEVDQVDQAELRWRILGDRLLLQVAVFTTGSSTSGIAMRRLVPWLTTAEQALTEAPLSIGGLEDIAAQWRIRREPFSNELKNWADVTIVEPIARRRATWWWKFNNGEQPPPPL